MSLSNFLVTLHFKLKKQYSKEYWEEKIANTKVEQVPPTPKIKDYKFIDDVFYFNENTNSDITIFYIHGGAYLNTFDKYHFKFINKLIKKTNASIIAPNYKLIPFSYAKEVIENLFNLYKDYIEKCPNKKIIFMGDSAGGGISLSLYLEIHKKGLKLPFKTIVLSPCTDITMDNPKIEEYKKYDPWLYTDRLDVCLKYFARDLDYKDYLVSPTYGNLDVFKNLLIFVGTKEILNPDIIDFYNKLPDKDTNKLIIKDKMLHVYPILPIKEAKESLSIITKYILE